MTDKVLQLFRVFIRTSMEENGPMKRGQRDSK